MFYVLGTVSFLLFLLGDLNDAFWHRRFLKPAFLSGSALLAASTLGSILCRPPVSFGPGKWLFLASALLFGALLIKALFFSFPPKTAYIDDSRQRTACTGGMYALCRHPGVVWFCLMYGCLVPGLSFSPGLAALYCLLNIALAFVEDRWIFPKIFSNYRAYQKTTPFLIPTVRSLRAWLKT